MVLAFWAALALIAWATMAGLEAKPAQATAAESGGAAAPVAVSAAAAPAAAPAAVAISGSGHYGDPALGFSFDYPRDWIPSALGPGDAPGAILGLPGGAVPGSAGGVEFPYSSHIDLSVIVQDTQAAGGSGWGAQPSAILAKMAASQGLAAAVPQAKPVHAVTVGKVKVEGLEYSPADATQHMWVVAQNGRHNYLFFLTVGGAAEDRGTVRQMFEEVIPSLSLTS